MNKPEKFWNEIIKNFNNPNKSVIQEWIQIDNDTDFIDTLKKQGIFESKCVCGTKIKHIHIFYHPVTGKKMIVGSCCKNKFNVRKWNSKKNYLYNALDLSGNETEKQFVLDLINKLTKWGSDLIISVNQKWWLENITKKPYNYKTW